MLAVHVIAASLAAAEPATAPPMETETAAASGPAAQQVISDSPPVIDISSPEMADDSSSRAPSAQSQQKPPTAQAPAASAEDFDLDIDHAGIEHDPFEGFNRVSFDISQAIDKILIRPAAMVYRHFPKPARDGVHNALSNMGEPLVFMNDLFQLRPDRALRTLGRFLLNSTLGIGGLFDVAKRKPFHLLHHDNTFGDTLGYYGVKPGPYIYVPIIGPTTLRDAIGSAEQLLPPLAIGEPLDRQDFQITTNVLDGLDQRERNDDDLKAMLRDAIDPYATFRANFLQNRSGEISALKSRQLDPGAVSSPADPLADPLPDPAAPGNPQGPKGQ